MTMTRFNWTLLAVIVAVAVIAGTALPSSSARTDGNWNTSPSPYTMMYLGHPLHCFVVEDGAEAGNIGALSCDFLRYWRSR